MDAVEVDNPEADALSAVTVTADRLTVADIDAWNDLIAGHPDYGSCVLRPSFVIAVATSRDDVRVTIYRRGARVIGVFAYHLRPGRLARPLGGPFADYAGPILAADAGLDATAILDLANLSAFKFQSLIDPYGVFLAHGTANSPSYIIDLTGTDVETLLETQRSAHPKRFKNFRRLRHQVERDGGVLELKFGPPDQKALETLFGWKRAQLKSSGLVDVLRPNGSGRLLEAVRQNSVEPCDAWLVSLHLNGEMIAGHFGLRCPESFHPWIAAYHPEYSAISPGNMLVRAAITEMPAMGLIRYDLAGGHDHFKKYYSNRSVQTYSGLVTLDDAFGRRARNREAMWERASGDESGVISRMKRRFDHIAVCEITASARISAGLAALILGLLKGRRTVGHKPG
ncbi:MAG: GNAT family N-acetyltransferase [Pseudomonadota bacterium]